ncbi:hypothetical protein Mlute_02827 [Meiothermus luteus]|uniref:Uncharacterized protein n=1 Tax=Meiothermus luteus TaxID=2026184 RepID=A0A399EAI7_9DEIN|nr:hypothetical protein Mlute_02827 [Meiothermus luteus]
MIRVSGTSSMRALKTTPWARARPMTTHPITNQRFIPNHLLHFTAPKVRPATR